MSEIDFDTTADYEAAAMIPEGWLKLAIMSAELTKDADNPNGIVLCEAQVVDGQHFGSKLKLRFSIYSSNLRAAAISKQQLAKLCDAAGIGERLTNTEDLINKVVKGHITITRGKKGGIFNNVNNFVSLATDTSAVETKGSRAAVGVASDNLYGD